MSFWKNFSNYLNLSDRNDSLNIEFGRNNFSSNNKNDTSNLIQNKDNSPSHHNDGNDLFGNFLNEKNNYPCHDGNNICNFMDSDDENDIELFEDNLFNHDNFMRGTVDDQNNDGNRPKYILENKSNYNGLFVEGKIDLHLLRQLENSKKCKAEYGHLKAYWPLYYSGVTLATGLDLGAQSKEEMLRYGVPKELVNKLSKYIGPELRGKAAEKFLKENPLEISVKEAEILNEFSVNKSAHRLAYVVKKYNEKNPENKVNLDDQPNYVVSTLFSYIYQKHYGKINELLRVLSKGDIEQYCKTHKNIDNGASGADPRRRADEAKYCLEEHKKYEGIELMIKGSHNFDHFMKQADEKFLNMNESLSK